MSKHLLIIWFIFISGQVQVTVFVSEGKFVMRCSESSHKNTNMIKKLRTHNKNIKTQHGVQIYGHENCFYNTWFYICVLTGDAGVGE